MSDHSIQNAEILAKVSLFQGLKGKPEALKSLGQMMTLKKFSVNQTLLTEGEIGDEFFVLVHGQVSIFKNTPEGDRYKVVILKADSSPAFGEGGLIESEPRSATIVCDQESTCLVLNRHDFLKFCDQYPQFAIPILQRLALNLMGNLRKTSNDLMLLHKALMNEIRS